MVGIGVAVKRSTGQVFDLRTLDQFCPIQVGMIKVRLILTLLFSQHLADFGFRLRITPISSSPSSGEIEMRKCGILTFIILFLPSMLVSQIGGARPAGTENETRATIFGGYSYLRNNTNGFNGWEGQGTFNFNRYLGVTADVSGASLTPFSFSALGFSAGAYQHLNNYLFGPTVTANLGRSAVFAHALFGEATQAWEREWASRSSVGSPPASPARMPSRWHLAAALISA
jgi:hypothetical protein